MILKRSLIVLTLILILFSCKTTNVQKKRVIARYSLAYEEGVKPELVLFGNNTFFMTFNLCEGMLDGEGVYRATKTGIQLAVKRCPNCADKNGGIAGLVIDLRTISNKRMRIESEVYHTGNDGKKYGFCAPKKGDVFVKKF